MFIIFGGSKEYRDGPEIAINCPMCGARVLAQTYEQLEKLTLFFFIPVVKVRNTLVTCPNCSEELISKISIDEIADLSAEIIEASLKMRCSFAASALAVLSILVW